MSNKIWYVTSCRLQQASDERLRGMLDNLCAELQLNDPALASVYRRLDWKGVNDQIVRETVQALASEMKCTFVSVKDKMLSHERIDGEFLGGLIDKAGEQGICWVRKKDGIHCETLYRDYDEDRYRHKHGIDGKLAKVQGRFGAVYGERCLTTTFDIISGGQMQIGTTRGGQIVVEAEIEVA